jgi:membrane-associated phospholipid phosphatase
MEAFTWERAIINWTKTLPQHGFIYEFFKFWSDYKYFCPLLLVLAVTLGVEFGWRKILTPSIAAIAAVATQEIFSRKIVKFFVEKSRPNFVHEGCGINECLGTVSSYCANVTAMAVVLCVYNRKNSIWAIPLIFLVAVSRIYLASDYPLDVAVGIILGILIGLLVYSIFRQSDHVTKL